MILVAGGSGRLGSLIVDLLSAQPLPVRVLTRDRERVAHLGERVEIVIGDVRDPSSLTAALRDVDVVISAVHGFMGVGGVSPASVDRDGNANLIDGAKTVGAELVLLSVVGASPDSPMELFRMKHAAEMWANASGVPSTIVRSTSFLELWVEILRDSARKSGRPIVFGRGANPINFVSVHDVAHLVERAVTDRSMRGETVEIGGPENLTFNQLAEAVQTADGRAGTARHVPTPMLRLIANTAGRVNVRLGRQARAALAMDRIDLRFDNIAIHSRFPDLPNVSLACWLANNPAASISTT